MGNPKKYIKMGTKTDDNLDIYASKLPKIPAIVLQKLGEIPKNIPEWEPKLPKNQVFVLLVYFNPY